MGSLDLADAAPRNMRHVPAPVSPVYPVLDFLGSAATVLSSILERMTIVLLQPFLLLRRLPALHAS